MSFQKAILLLQSLEGGMIVSNLPDDPGRSSFCGITKSTWTDYLIKNNISFYWPPTPQDVNDFYNNEFWTPCKCSSLPEPADSVYLQLVINILEEWRVKLLQCAVGARPVDGDHGPKTQIAIQTTNGIILANSLLAIQDGYYSLRPSPYLTGLLDRTMTVRKALQNGSI